MWKKQKGHTEKLKYKVSSRFSPIRKEKVKNSFFTFVK
jgi:hypothetical protein